MENQNELAERICEREGGKQNLNIAQVKEVLKATLEELAKLPASAVMALVESHKK